MTQEEAFDNLVAHDIGFVVRPGILADSVRVIAEVIEGITRNETPANHDLLLTLVEIAKEAI